MKGTLIGKFRNDWRQRWVSIFEDTDDSAMVYTEGFPFLGTAAHHQTVVTTHEPRELFAPYIGTFNKVFQ